MTSSEGDGPKRLGFLGGTDLSDYLDFIIRRGEEVPFFEAVADLITTHGELWDTLDLHCLPSDSPTLEHLVRICEKSGFPHTLVMEDVCPRVELPSSWETFLAGMNRKNRHEIRRKSKKIRREAGEYRYLNSSAPFILQDMESFIELHKKSDPAKAVFMNQTREDFFREMASCLHRAGWLDISFLEANGRRLAGLVTFKYGDSLYLYNSGYDKEFGHWSPGWVLISHSIEDAISKGVKTYDFLRGNESYKYRFGARDYVIYRYTVYRREEH